MKRGLIIGAIVIALIAVLFIIIYSSSKENSSEGFSDRVVISKMEIFDSSNGTIKERSVEGDFTYSLGTISNSWIVGYPRYTPPAHRSLFTKIDRVSLENVNEDDCKLAKYGLEGEHSAYLNSSILLENGFAPRVFYSLDISDGDIFCFSVDQNNDGLYGDRFFAIQILDGAKSGPMTFIYKKF